MNYATVADMRARYRDDLLNSLLRRVGTAELDTEKLDRALTDASALIEGYLSARYALPLSAIPRLLTQHCCAIAFYYLNDERATEQTTQRYKDALRWLNEVKNGDLQLGVDEDNLAPEGIDLPQMVADAPVFSRKQQGFI
ncbi:gp436 family protein [Edwardsiella piscicida]